MPTDKIPKYILPNIPYLFIGWVCLKLGTAYRLAAGAGFGEKLLGLGRSIGPAFADFAPGLDPFDWLVGLVGAVPECFPDGRGTGRLAGQFSHCMGPVHRKAVRIHGLYR